MPGPEADALTIEVVLAEAHQSRGAADDKLYQMSSVPDDRYEPALGGESGTEAYRASDAELAAMPAWARKRLLAQRARSPIRWAARDAMYAQDLAARRALVGRLNRALHMRTIEVDGVPHHHGQCACGWRGLRVLDPEVARREYDTHACAIEGDAHIDRAIASHAGLDQLDANMHLIVEKREPHEMQARAVVEAWNSVADVAAVEMAKYTDDAEARFALLELK